MNSVPYGDPSTDVRNDKSESLLHSLPACRNIIQISYNVHTPTRHSSGTLTLVPQDTLKFFLTLKPDPFHSHGVGKGCRRWTGLAIIELAGPLFRGLSGME